MPEIGGRSTVRWRSPNREMYSWHYSLTASMQEFWMGILCFRIMSTAVSKKYAVIVNVIVLEEKNMPLNSIY